MSPLLGFADRALNLMRVLILLVPRLLVQHAEFLRGSLWVDVLFHHCLWVLNRLLVTLRLGNVRLRGSHPSACFLIWIALRCCLSTCFCDVFGVALIGFSSFGAVLTNSLEVAWFYKACDWGNHWLSNIILFVYRQVWTPKSHWGRAEALLLSDDLRRILKFLRRKFVILVEVVLILVAVIDGLIIFNEIGPLLGKLHFHLLLVFFEIQKIALLIIGMDIWWQLLHAKVSVVDYAGDQAGILLSVVRVHPIDQLLLSDELRCLFVVRCCLVQSSLFRDSQE